LHVALPICCAKTGMDIYAATPAGYGCDGTIIEQAKQAAAKSGSKVVLTGDPEEAVRNADVIYTDTWVSMGQEAEKEMRIKIFMPYQVNQKLFSKAKDDAFLLHCLPAYRGLEVTEEIIDGPHSMVIEEAENRLHVQKAIMATLMG
ncbi:MAG: ornithine carbamoyltransferase, partial [Eubacteriales bacterium]|nr:ornithine carbamoyltransferase [Eubacteriales bacterium]